MILDDPNKPIASLVICIKSIEIDSLSNMYYKQKYNKFIKWPQNNYFFYLLYKLLLKIIYNLLNKIENKTTRIITILYYYSKSCQSFQNYSCLVNLKYDQRYQYRYKKYFKNCMVNQNKLKKTQKNKVDLFALTNLYIIYKILSAQNSFFVYQKLIQNALNY